MVKIMIQKIKHYYWPLLLASILAMSAQIFHHYDTQVNQIVKDFVVSSQSVAGDDLYISGRMTKARDCQILQFPKIYNNFGDLMIVEFGDTKKDEKLTSRANVVQNWGPWVVKNIGRSEYLTVTTLHRCHFGWTDGSELLTFRIER